MNATFTGSAEVSPHVRTFYFQASQPFRYVAGQFVDLTVRHDGTDDRGDWRQFTLSSSPTESQLAITVRFQPDGGSSFKRALLSLQPGTVVQMSQAMGDFVLPLSEQTPLVFIAGGIGITPFRSMAKWLADSGENRPVELLHVARGQERSMFDEVFRAAGVSRLDLTTLDQAAGTITAMATNPDEALYYVSGPETMVDAIRSGLLESGIEPYRIITDTFLGYATA